MIGQFGACILVGLLAGGCTKAAPDETAEPTATDQTTAMTVSDGEGVTTGATLDQPADASLPISAAGRLQAIHARNGPEGTERVVLVYDGLLPSEQIVRVEDFERAIRAAPTYTTQQGAPLLICGNEHSSGPGVRAIDLLLPATWFDEDSEASSLPVTPDDSGGEEYFGTIGKIIVCPPSEQVVQVSILLPASIDGEQIDAAIEERQITIDIEPSEPGS